MRTLLLALSFFAGCTCRPTVTMVEEEPLVIAPTSLRFADTFVGATASAELEVTNPSRVARAVTVELSPPFSLETTPDALSSGGMRLRVLFTPVTAGEAATVLRLGGLEVPLSGRGLAPLSCDSPNVCTATRFDPVAGRCVASAKPDGEACQTRCVMGQCRSERCEGAAMACPETRCTVGVCSEDTGCGVVARTCAPPSNPCQRARCDEASGCLIEDADDGVVCGVDDCRLDTVNVCITGQCVTRTRPGSGRCTRTWLPLALGSRSNPVLGYDVVGRRMLLFAGGGSFGSSDDTWAWNGQTWSLVIPANSPSSRNYTVVATDELRRRLVLFGGLAGASTAANDTWEWDGTTWLSRTPSGPKPPPRFGASLVWDAARQRTWLFSGAQGGGYLSDFWEWNGLVWRQVQPAVMPPPRLFGQFVYDPVRRVSVLFGGVTNSGSGDEQLVDTWEWDGTSWTQKAGVAAAFTTNAAAWDPVGRRVLAYRASARTAELWAYDGTWTQVMVPSLPPLPSAAMALDPVRRTVVLVGGGDTWEWDGLRFTLIVRQPIAPVGTLPVAWDPLVSSPLVVTLATPWHLIDGGWVATAVDGGPDERSQASFTFDSARRRFVLFGGARGPGLTADLWEWDGSTWSLRPTPGATPCERPESAFDAVRGRTVYVGCPLDDGGHTAWEWDGTTWSSFDGAPSALLAAWDSQRQEFVVVDRAGVTWVRSGLGWTQRADAGTVPTNGKSVAFDPVRGVLVVVASPTFNNPQTWEWNGTVWSRPPLAHQPPETSTGGRLLYDEVGRRTLFVSTSLYEYVP